MSDGRAGVLEARVRDRAYRPIRDYAFIGDCHGAALVAGDGSVDWCCLGRFDVEPAVWRLLDAVQGGFFEVAAVDAVRITRAYLSDTNVLQTIHTSTSGRVAVTDFMPVDHAPDAPAGDFVTLHARGWLVRVVDCLEGSCQVRVRLRRPTSKFAGQAQLYRVFTEGVSPEGADSADEVFSLGAGERRRFVLAPASAAAARPADSADRLLAATRKFWEAWCGRCVYAGPYADAVRRSALTLKALTYAPTGAVVAAATTSLPEEPGGVRNWDYRFSWLRDSSFVLQALATLGYGGEADAYCEFLRSCCVQTLPDLQILYPIDQHSPVAERSLDHVAGYAGARPVRVGNGAHGQRQVDIYGEIADWALVYHAVGRPLDETLARLLRETANRVAVEWGLPDQGIWEMRGEPRHHVHGKAMAWVALDRALKLLGPNPSSEQSRDEVIARILAQGVSDGGHLVQAFGTSEPDAALLPLTLLDLPIEKSVLVATVEAVQARLRNGDYLYRYLTEDGLPGGEGAFLICSFWLVDALLVVDRPQEARALFERLLAKANDLGLYAEEIEPRGEAFLGNFPQAFTHLALINSAIHLHLHDAGGVAALAGTHADRTLRARSLQKPVPAQR